MLQRERLRRRSQSALRSLWNQRRSRRDLHAASELWNSERLRQRRGKWVEPYTNIGGCSSGQPEPIRTSCRKAGCGEIVAQSVATHESVDNERYHRRQFWQPADRQGRERSWPAFDGNIFSLGGDYGYDAAKNRSVCVDSRALLEGMRRVYHLDRIVDEIEGPRK